MRRCKPPAAWLHSFRVHLSYLGPIRFPCSHLSLHSPSSLAFTVEGDSLHWIPGEPSSHLEARNHRWWWHFLFIDTAGDPCISQHQPVLKPFLLPSWCVGVEDRGWEAGGFHLPWGLGCSPRLSAGLCGSSGQSAWHPIRLGGTLLCCSSQRQPLLSLGDHPPVRPSAPVSHPVVSTPSTHPSQEHSLHPDLAKLLEWKGKKKYVYVYTHTHTHIYHLNYYEAHLNYSKLCILLMANGRNQRGTKEPLDEANLRRWWGTGKPGCWSPWVAESDTTGQLKAA